MRWRTLSWCGIGSFVGLSVFAGAFDNWDLRNPLPQPYSLNAVTFGSGQFVAVGGQGTIMVSTNGIDWTKRPTDVGNRHLFEVTFAEDRFVAVGGYVEGASRPVSLVMTSTDGREWIKCDIQTYEVTIQGPAGTYRIESAGDLAPDSWTPVMTVTATNGPLVVPDLPPSKATRRFHRAVLVRD